VRALLSCAAAWLCLAAPASADVFNGRIAFSSVRTDPQEKSFDIFSMNPDGTGVRRLTTNPAADRQPDWSPDGTAIAHTIDKPGATKNYEVARMSASGTSVRRLTTTVTDQASSQPSWLRDGSAILFRRSGPYDVRLAGAGVTCRQARGLARRWVQAGRPPRVRGYAATATTFGGTRRVELRRRDGGRRRLVAFLYQRSAGR
jgi:dipeptidyl aminopeptidase/acylaminoacyl peptidase